MDWIEKTVYHLNNNEVILCPTDTIWGLSGNALQTQVLERVYEIKQRPKEKSFILLVASITQLKKYVADDLEAISKILEDQHRPTTVIYSKPKGSLPKELLAKDGSIAIRIPKPDWLQSILTQINFPILSTSANISGQASPKDRNQISNQILEQVDFIANPSGVVQTGESSQIIKIGGENEISWIRK